MTNVSDPGILKTVTEPLGDGGFISGGYDPNYSGEQIVLAANLPDLKPGTMLGRVAVGALSATAGAAVSGTGAAPGNGTFGAITVDPGAPVGRYMLRFTDATHFEMLLPDGTIEGNGTLGVAYDGNLNFTHTAGGTPYVEDDRVPVDVVAGAASGQYKPIDPAAKDGTQIWAGILFGRRGASAATQRATSVARHQVVNGNLLTYVNAVNGAQKAAIEAQAAAAGVIIRY
jgi:hypothetical protein